MYNWNGNFIFQDYEDFDLANEDGKLSEFLGIKID